MKKLKKGVKVTLSLIIGVAVLMLCVKGLMLQDQKEKERAEQEGRTEIHYTSTGEVYYK